MKKAISLVLSMAFFISACGVYQPTVSLAPSIGDDPRWDTECRRWAQSVTPPVTQGDSAAGGALGGAAIGAGGGALGGWAAGNTGKGAAIGAGIGALLGLLAGAARESQKSAAAQHYVDQAYINCINAKRAAASQQAPPPPPPAALSPAPQSIPGCRPSGKYVKTPQGGFVEICE